MNAEFDESMKRKLWQNYHCHVSDIVTLRPTEASETDQGKYLFQSVRNLQSVNGTLHLYSVLSLFVIASFYINQLD